MTYINHLFLILISSILLVSCTFNPVLKINQTDDESIFIKKPEFLYEFKKFPKKINIIYSNSNESEVKNFIEGISANYFYYLNLKYGPELNFLNSEDLKAMNCTLRNFSRSYSIIFFNSTLNEQLLDGCLSSLLKLNGLIILFNNNLKTQNSNLTLLEVDRKKDYLDLLNFAKDQGNKNSIIIDDENTKDKDQIAKVWNGLNGRIIKSSRSRNKQNEKLLSEILLIENSKSRAIQLSRILSTQIEYTPRRREDIDSLILSVSLPKARSLKPALEYNFAESIPVYLASDWKNINYYQDSEIDLEGIILIDFPWMLSTSPERDSSLQRKKSRDFAVGYDAYELMLLLNNNTSRRNYIYEGLSGKISINQGKLNRQSLIVKVVEGSYKLLKH